MEKEKELSQEQKAKNYCTKNGHASFVYYFWGYVHCGRCGTQIGDRLAGIFPLADKVAVISCPDSPCKSCDPAIKQFNKLDKEIFERRKKHPDWTTEKVLRGLKIEDN